MSKIKKPSAEKVELPPPGSGLGKLKAFGGSMSDDLNAVLANQAFSALWTVNSNDEGRQQQIRAAAAALAGIKPTEELEGTGLVCFQDAFRLVHPRASGRGDHHHCVPCAQSL